MITYNKVLYKVTLGDKKSPPTTTKRHSSINSPRRKFAKEGNGASFSSRWGNSHVRRQFKKLETKFNQKVTHISHQSMMTHHI